MQKDVYAKFALALLVLALSCGTILAQDHNMAHTHIGHVMTSFKDTPQQQGLLPTAIAEAKVMIQHAQLAAKNPNDLAAMKLHAGHVLHVVSPDIEPNGPGSGYGLKKAILGARQHTENAAKADGATKNVKTHAVHVEASLNHAIQLCNQVASYAEQIRNSNSAANAARLVSEMKTAAMQVMSGVDANQDGKVSWEINEGGLEQAEMHMKLMMKGEGL